MQINISSFTVTVKFRLFQSEKTSVELEYNKKWEIEDFLKFLKGEAMILHLWEVMEKTKKPLEITYGMQSVQKDTDSGLELGKDRVFRTADSDIQVLSC